MTDNLLALAIISAFALVGAIVVGALSSQSLREDGLRKLVRRWLRR